MSPPSALHQDGLPHRNELAGVALIIARLSGLYAICGGSLSIAGWVFDLPILADWDLDGIAMFVNTAICAMLCGAAVLLFTGRRRSPGRLGLVRAAGGLAATIAALTLFEHLSGIDLGIDTLLFDRPWGQRASTSPMRMGPPASISFSLLGAAIWLHTCSSRARRWAGTLSMIVVGISSLSLVGYFFGAGRLFVVARTTGIAWQTSSMLFLLGLSLAALSTEHALVAAFRRDDIAGVLTRRLVLPIIVLPLLLGRLEMLGQDHGLYDAAFGTAVLMLSMIAMLIALLLWAASGIANQTEAARTAEMALRDREARLRSTFDQAAVGMALADLDGQFVEMNHKFAEILGYTVSELCRLKPYDVTHPDDLEDTREYMGRLLAGEISSHACEKRYLRKDGVVVWSLTTVTMIKDETGAPQRFIGVIEDITARKRAEQALVESEERFTRFMQHLPGLAWIKDAEGRYVFANDAAEKAFRTPRSGLYGKTDDQVFPTEFAEQFKANDQRAIASLSGVQSLEVLEHSDGQLHYSIVNKFPYPGAGWRASAGWRHRHRRHRT
jgi:PAS domain S-box-containing protein